MYLMEPNGQLKSQGRCLSRFLHNKSQSLQKNKKAKQQQQPATASSSTTGSNRTGNLND